MKTERKQWTRNQEDFGCAAVATALLLLSGFLAVPAAKAAPSEIRAEKPASKGGYEIRSLWSVGGPDAEDSAQFYERIGGVGFDSDAQGRLYVLDDGNHRVQVFGPGGEFLRSFGSEGKGPGEFNLPQTLAANAQGEVAVYDVGNQRVSIFGPEGNLLRDQLVAGAVREIELTDDGELVCSVANRYELVGYGPDGKVTFEYGRSAPPQEEREVNIETPFQTVSSRLLATGDHEFVMAGRGEYGVTRFEGGNPSLRWSRPFERQELRMPERSGDDEGKPQVVMIMSREDAGGEGAPEGNTQSWTSGEGESEMHFDLNDLQKLMPKYVPDVRGLLAWPDGRVWVITAEDEGDRMVVDEWDTGGRYLHRFSMPQYSWLVVGKDGALYGLTHDDDDYPFVHRLEAVPAD